ncbi:MAG TPA: glucosidase [Acidobacteriota bacterium]|nr:glucosidase [Acidobacteriota bacterium]HNH83119.1 glucosidase [Acidobacteriota bacterium]
MTQEHKNPSPLQQTAEAKRLEESRNRTAHWKRWGPYVSERAWGTVREDYSPYGSAWDYFPHDHARSKAYRWGEDGLAGISDRRQFICFALSLWNENDPILKERLFGLTGPEGNHGEDVKEYYFYLDSTPTHSYMKWLYKYPQAAFPYWQLIQENRNRSRAEPEFELLDTGIFNENRYFDVTVEYAKASPDDLHVRISVINRGPDPAPIHVLPVLWFRNTWTWKSNVEKPKLYRIDPVDTTSVVELNHPYYGKRWLYCEDSPELLFTENDTNVQRLYNAQNPTPYVKDGINEYVVNHNAGAVNPAQFGTKVSPHYKMVIQPGETKTISLRLTDHQVNRYPLGAEHDHVLAARKQEADEFYSHLISPHLSVDAQNVQRQAFAGMLWSKQFFYYVIEEWLNGDQTQPKPPAERRKGRNKNWAHLYNEDIISMPDKWEYPWYAAWDLAFHCVPLAQIDPDFAKEQLILMLREWYMHPNGQLPAYEWAFDDVNPPVHAWAAWRVYKIEKRIRGVGDRRFLERVFQKLLLNFTWWINRKDAEGNNVFQGGFLGLDNIGVFDRSAVLPTGGHLEQSDATSWMGMYCLNMLAIALELAHDNMAYEDVASKFYEHFLYIANAMNHISNEDIELWSEKDGFFYDVLQLPNGSHFKLRVRSMVGLIPLFAAQTMEADWLKQLPGFRKRMDWFVKNRPELQRNISSVDEEGNIVQQLLSIVNASQLRRVLKVMLNEAEFLSDHGIRSVSRFHLTDPYVLQIGGQEYRVDYDPAESSTGLFGGNSNWRGPIWFPVNYLIIESIQKFHHFFGDDFKVEFPTGSGNHLNLWEVSVELSRRLTRIFLKDENGRRPVYDMPEMEKFQTDPNWQDLVLFYEYFHGDSGRGIGASHQTGWTGLVAKLLAQSGEGDSNK